MVSALLRQARRWQLTRRALPDAWRAIADERLPFVAPFDDVTRARFFLHLKLFAREKAFVGIEGLVVTDEMRVVVAGCAAQLSLHLTPDLFNDLGTVVLAPGDLERHDDARILGRAHGFGTIVLSWSAVTHGLAADDGHNVTVHELAHILDAADGGFDGTPVLETPRDVRAFAHAFSRAFVAMRGKEATSPLRAYAATNEAEFFAVATEAFFEKPRVLKRKLPEVYAALVTVYRCDPAA